MALSGTVRQGYECNPLNISHLCFLKSASRKRVGVRVPPAAPPCFQRVASQVLEYEAFGRWVQSWLLRNEAVRHGIKGKVLWSSNGAIGRQSASNPL